MNNNYKMINYIKAREEWRDTRKEKNRAQAEIFSGAKTFAMFLIYWAIEKFLLNYDELYKQNPNFKYLFYVSLTIGVMGIITALWGVFKYFYATEKLKQAQQQVEVLERDLVG